MKLNFLQFDQFKMIDIYDSCRYYIENIPNQILLRCLNSLHTIAVCW